MTCPVDRHRTPLRFAMHRIFDNLEGSQDMAILLFVSRTSRRRSRHNLERRWLHCLTMHHGGTISDFQAQIILTAKNI